MTVKNTRDEVVDVLDVQAPTKKLARCLGEAVWAFDLDGAFTAIEQQRWHVEVNR